MTDGRRSALRAQLNDMNDGRPPADRATVDLAPVTQELMDRLGHALLWRIVIEPYIPKQKGMIARPAEVEDAERILSKVSRVVMVGSQAWKSKTPAGINLEDEPHKPGIGDYVLHEMYAGTEITLTTGHKLRVITETECLLVVKDPDLIRAYT